MSIDSDVMSLVRAAAAARCLGARGVIVTFAAASATRSVCEQSMGVCAKAVPLSPNASGSTSTGVGGSVLARPAPARGAAGRGDSSCCCWATDSADDDDDDTEELVVAVSAGVLLPVVGAGAVGEVAVVVVGFLQLPHGRHHLASSIHSPFAPLKMIPQQISVLQQSASTVRCVC